MIDVVTGLTATKTGLEIIKAVREALKKDKVDAADINARLGELQESLYQAREALGDAQEAHRSLSNEMYEMKRQADISADMEFIEDGQFYTRKSERAAGKRIAYCPLCWKASKQDVPLYESEPGYYTCRLHENTWYETNAKRGGARTASTHDFDPFRREVFGEDND